MLRVSDEVRRLSTLLLDEVQTWPEVSTRPMFGLIGVYRGKMIFAALPRTRAIDFANSFIFKLRSPSSKLLQRAAKDARIRIGEGKQGWASFQINEEQDLRGALEWLDQAWRQAKSK